MIILIKAKQRKGKTTVAVAIVYWLVNILKLIMRQRLESVRTLLPANIESIGYKTSEIHSNIRLYQPDGTELKEYHYYATPNEMRAFVRRMIAEKIRHIILLIDEIDAVFSHRFWQKQEQQETLIGLWRDEKAFNVIIGTCHVGASVDLIIREAMAKECVVQIDKLNDCVDMVVINDRDREMHTARLNHVRFIQTLFNSWEL